MALRGGKAMKVKSRLLMGALSLALISGCAWLQPSSPTKGMFVVVTDPEPEVQLMALVLSTQALEQGKYVRVLVCGPAGKLVVRDSEQTLVKPLNKSPQMLLKGLVSRDVEVNVCPLYLAERGLKPEVLIDGVGIGTPSQGIDAVLEDGVKLFTF
jgi:predicted peroxiredoxin